MSCAQVISATKEKGEIKFGGKSVRNLRHKTSPVGLSHMTVTPPRGNRERKACFLVSTLGKQKSQVGSSQAENVFRC